MSLNEFKERLKKIRREQLRRIKIKKEKSSDKKQTRKGEDIQRKKWK